MKFSMLHFFLLKCFSKNRCTVVNIAVFYYILWIKASGKWLNVHFSSFCEYQCEKHIIIVTTQINIPQTWLHIYSFCLCVFDRNTRSPNLCSVWPSSIMETSWLETQEESCWYGPAAPLNQHQGKGRKVDTRHTRTHTHTQAQTLSSLPAY